jgi:hypothetical protein
MTFERLSIAAANTSTFFTFTNRLWHNNKIYIRSTFIGVHLDWLSKYPHHSFLLLAHNKSVSKLLGPCMNVSHTPWQKNYDLRFCTHLQFLSLKPHSNLVFNNGFYSCLHKIKAIWELKFPLQCLERSSSWKLLLKKKDILCLRQLFFNKIWVLKQIHITVSGTKKQLLFHPGITFHAIMSPLHSRNTLLQYHTSNCTPGISNFWPCW